MTDRDKFKSKIGVILATAGAAVGLGNIWRFPVETGQNGGAAYIIIYICFILLVGIPVMLAEFVLGRHTYSNPIAAFRHLAPHTQWVWVGRLGVFSGLLILSYYSVVAGWTVEYSYLAITNAFDGGTPQDYKDVYLSFVSEPILPIIYLVLILLATHFVIVRGIRKGIEKFSMIMMPMLLVMLLVLVVCSVTLSGAGEGLEYLLKPDFSKITNKTVINAMGQSFFSLSLGLGALCTYASYFDENTRLVKSAFTIGLLDTCVAILSGFIIFPSMFHVGHHVNSSDIGPSLLFVTLPNVFHEAFDGIPLLGYLFPVVFYLLLVVASITSTISMLEIVVTYISEEYKVRRSRASLFVTFISVVIAVFCSLSFGVLKDFTILGMTIFELLDKMVSNLFLPIGGMFFSIFVGWKMKKQLVVAELTNHGNLSMRFVDVIIFILRYIAPIAIILIIFNQLDIISLLNKLDILKV